MQYESFYSIGDGITVYLEDVTFAAKITAVHFNEAKVHYDVEVNNVNGDRTIIHYLDSVLFEKPCEN